MTRTLYYDPSDFASAPDNPLYWRARGAVWRELRGMMARGEIGKGPSLRAVHLLTLAHAVEIRNPDCGADWVWTHLMNMVKEGD